MLYSSAVIRTLKLFNHLPIACSFLFFNNYFYNRSKSLRTPSNAFIVNLAITDFLMMSKTPIFIYNSFSQGFVLGATACSIYAGVGVVSGGCGALSNLMIAFDRYR